MRFNVWDVAGNLQSASFGDGCYAGAACAIIAYDASNPEAHVPVLEDWRAKLGAIPIVIMGTHRGEYAISDINRAKYTLSPAIFVNSMTKEYIESPFAELARALAHVELLTRLLKIPVARSERTAFNIQEILCKYEFIPFIQCALVELRKDTAQLLARSGLIATSDVCSAHVACSSSNIIAEFAATYGITMTYDNKVDDGAVALERILNEIASATYPTPNITQKFIDTMDRSLFDFIIARISMIHGVFRGGEQIYRTAIEDIANKIRVTMA
jgi:hypothetical protein